MNDIRESLDDFISDQLSEKLIQAIDELPQIPQLTKEATRRCNGRRAPNGIVSLRTTSTSGV